MFCTRCGDEMEEVCQVETDIMISNEGEQRTQRQRMVYKCETCGNVEAEEWQESSP